MKDSLVEFAGYSVPHPSEPIVQVRVQTTAPPLAPTHKKKKKSKKGRTDYEDTASPPAIDRFKVACTTLSSQCGIVLEQWEKLLPEVKEDQLRMDQLLLEEMYTGDDAGEEEQEGEDGGEPMDVVEEE